MSISVSSASEFLPNLPGFNVSRRQQSGIKTRSFDIVNGEMFMRTPNLPMIKNSGDDGSVWSIGSPVGTQNMSRSRSPLHDVNVILTFHALFEDFYTSGQGVERRKIRKCSIYYYVENGTISIMEKPQANSGIAQGTLLKRQVVCKIDGSPYTYNDLKVGTSIHIFGRSYQIYDCDRATKSYLRRAMAREDLSYLGENSVALEPLDMDEPSTASEYDDWAKFHSKKNYNKTFLEAMLGNTVNNEGRAGFIKFGSNTLKFLCIWDNTGTLYGDQQQYSLVYYLCDDTIQIYALASSITAKEQFPRLLKRSKLPKHPTVKALGDTDRDEIFYHWSDIHIGLELNVYSRVLRIVDADETTRKFYETNSKPLGPAVARTTEFEIMFERQIPPPTAFGSEEDSLRSCQGSILPSQTHQKKIGEDKKLSFFAKLLSGGPDDADRNFVITYFVQDGTIKIQEPPVRNSGFQGGAFLSRRVVKAANGEPITHLNLFIGSTLTILKHRFKIHGAIENTLRWMEDKRHPRASFYDILEKITPTLFEDASSGELTKKFAALEGPYGRGLATKETMKTVFSEYDLIDEDHSENESYVTEHELMTIVRANGNKLSTFNYTKLIEQIISPTDEFK
jgi:hypothetical protein